MHQPGITIITTVLDSPGNLEQSILSIINQTYTNLEYIVIDGGSSGATLEIIRKYSGSISYWCSEKDSGIADAMNKGIRAAGKEFILFIHADDYLADDTAIERAMQQVDSTHEIYVYKVCLVDGARQFTSRNRGLGFLTNFKMGSCHQGQIISRQLLLRSGLLDTGFRIGMDYDFMLRAYRMGAAAKPVDQVLSVMRLTGISSRRSWTGLKERFMDEKKAHFKNTDSIWLSIVYRIYWPLYLAYRYSRFLLTSTASGGTG